jgi:hypothetical protein
MATEAPSISTPTPASAPVGKQQNQHLLIPGGDMARLATRAGAVRPNPWYAVWELAILQASLETFEGLAASPGARPERAFRWMLAGAALGWGMPAMASLLRTSAPLFTVLFVYLGLVALTVIAFVAATGAAHALADQLDASGSYGAWVFVCAAVAAPLTVAAGLMVSGPAPLRLLLLPTALFALLLTVQAARAVYGLAWRPALIVTVPSVVLLALLPLAAVAGAWAGLVGW